MLQKPREEDLFFIRQLWSDPATMAPVGGTIAMDEQSARQWYQRMVKPGSNGDRYFLIREVEQDRFIGEASLHRWQHSIGLAELNIKVMDNFRGSGFGRQALASGHQLDFPDPPALVEVRLQWAIETQDCEPPLAGDGLDPVALLTRRSLRTKVHVY